MVYKDTAVSHLRDVHLCASLGLAAAGFGVRCHFNGTLSGSDMMTVAQWILMVLIGVTHVSNKQRSLTFGRLVMLVLFCVAAGANTGTWIEKALMEVGICRGFGWKALPDLDWLASWLTSGAACDSGLIWEALVLTAGIYACFVVGAMLAPKRSFFWLYSFISVGMWVMFFTYLFARLGWIGYQSFDLVYVRGGLVLYAAKTGYDTQLIMEKFDRGDHDVVQQALTMALNFLHLFIRVITILADSKKKKK